MVLIRDVGEKRFIRDLLSQYAATSRADSLEDCIVIDPGARDAPLIVYSMDHPSPIDRPLPPDFEWRYYGRWIAACTCNDVLAMGARPRGFSLDLAVPEDTETAAVAELYDGITDVLREYGAVFEGGNTDINANTGTVGMSWGSVPRSGIIRRRGARPGDRIAVTTQLGVGWASYLLRKRGGFERLSPASRKELEEYNLLPLAPHEAIIETAARLPGAITSGMDLSDGLAEFVYTIAETPGLGAVVQEERIPVSPLLKECAALLGVPAAALAIEYGFDMPRAHGYTVAADRWEQVEECFVACGSPLFCIGEVTADPGVTWLRSARRSRPVPKLWDDKCRRADAIRDWLAMAERDFV